MVSVLILDSRKYGHNQIYLYWQKWQKTVFPFFTLAIKQLFFFTISFFQIVTNRKNLNCKKTQIATIQNSKTQIVT